MGDDRTRTRTRTSIRRRTRIRTRKRTRTSKYMKYTLIQHSDTTPDIDSDMNM